MVAGAEQRPAGLDLAADRLPERLLGRRSVDVHVASRRPDRGMESIDISRQPFDYSCHDGTIRRGVNGHDCLATVALTDPAGRTSTGLAQLEIAIEGRYDPLGLE